MIKRLSVISTAVLVALLISGLAWASSDDSSSSSTTSTSTTLVPSAAAGAQTATGSETYDAGAAGQVTVDQSGASLSIGNVAANTDWTHEVEVASGREVEVKFLKGNERIDFHAELEDGVVKTRVRTRTLDGSAQDGSGDDSQALTAPSTDALAFDADEAGAVQLRASNGTLELISAVPNAGWTVADIEIEGSREINVEFRNGTTEIEFKAEMEDDMVKTRVRTETDDDAANDDSSDDSNSEPGKDDSDEDNSGRSHDDEDGDNSIDD